MSAPNANDMHPFVYRLLRMLHVTLEAGLHLERRFEPLFRRTLNRLLREPTAKFLQYTINVRRPNLNLSLAEEQSNDDEDENLNTIIERMMTQMRENFTPGSYERGGNTKTHGIVKATVTVLDDIPAAFRHGVFTEAQTYPAWIRFAGPGPDVPSDINDVGFGSMSIKLMNVPGHKLMDEESATQDLICVSTPTFVTPNTRANANLQYWSLLKLPIFHFLNPRNSHIRDMIMQALWNETMYNPLGTRYWSCVPYLLGPDQAMMYSFVPRSNVETHIPGLPFGAPSFNYLRDNMKLTLDKQSVEFDLMVQVQTDAHRMPIEHAGVRWPESLSPFVPVARIRIPAQTFDTDQRKDFSKRLKMNPWHSLAEHRPLGNQSRARRRMYQTLSDFRQQMNAVSHSEPNTDDTDWIV